MPEKILETYFVPALADISIKGSRKGQKGQEKINQMKQKFSVRFENFLEEYESIFTECGIEIMETRLFASEIEQQKRLPEDNLRKAIVRFRKVYLYISEKELSAEKCGERLMKKYRANKWELERTTHNLGFQLCKKQKKDDGICKVSKFGFSQKLSKPTQKMHFNRGTRWFGIVQQDLAGI